MMEVIEKARACLQPFQNIQNESPKRYKVILPKIDTSSHSHLPKLNTGKANKEEKGESLKRDQ
jgi:hypothetical protein